MNDQVYQIGSARSPEQAEYMRSQGDTCVFCEKPYANPNEVLNEGEFWYLTENRFPYEGAKHHYLFVSQIHVGSFFELPDEAGAELWAMKRNLVIAHGAEATATVERSGDIQLTAASIAHLHVHFVVPDLNPTKTVRFRVSKFGTEDQGRVP